MIEKGFIVVDVPERCSLCRYMHRTDEDYCFCYVEGYGFDYQVNEYMQSKPKGKPDWCPIHILPERKSPMTLTLSPLIKKQYSEFDKGWNACLDYLEGKNGK